MIALTREITQEKRFLLAFLVSVALHGLLFGGSYLLSRTGILQQTAEEIYSMSDVVEDLVPAEPLQPAPAGRNATRRIAANVSFLLISPAEAKELSGNTQRISRAIRDEKLKQQRKAIPVVKNPAVKPKLTQYSPVPYPAAAGGTSGTVTVCILVGYDGRPEYASIAGSSGNRFLDAAAVEHCITWRFTPARDGKGRLLSSFYLRILIRVEKTRINMTRIK